VADAVEPDAAKLPTSGSVGYGRDRVFYVGAVLGDGTVREHPGDLIPWLAAEDLPPEPDPAPRRRVRGF
jgi:hypothetical protein